jgi:hypothetical protein
MTPSAEPARVEAWALFTVAKFDTATERNNPEGNGSHNDKIGGPTDGLLETLGPLV